MFNGLRGMIYTEIDKAFKGNANPSREDLYDNFERIWTKFTDKAASIEIDDAKRFEYMVGRFTGYCPSPDTIKTLFSYFEQKFTVQNTSFANIVHKSQVSARIPRKRNRRPKAVPIPLPQHYSLSYTIIVDDIILSELHIIPSVGVFTNDADIPAIASPSFAYSEKDVRVATSTKKRRRRRRTDCDLLDAGDNPIALGAGRDRVF